MDEKYHISAMVAGWCQPPCHSACPLRQLWILLESDTLWYLIWGRVETSLLVTRTAAETQLTSDYSAIYLQIQSGPCYVCLKLEVWGFSRGLLFVDSVCVCLDGMVYVSASVWI
jgi:hypothetical protein